MSSRCFRSTAYIFTGSIQEHDSAFRVSREYAYTLHIVEMCIYRYALAMFLLCLTRTRYEQHSVYSDVMAVSLMQGNSVSLYPCVS